MALSDEDKTWLGTEVFTWVGPSFVGAEFASEVYTAVAAALDEGDPAKAALYLAAAEGKRNYLPARMSAFIDEKVGLARRWIDAGTLPPPGEEFSVLWNEELPETTITARPVPVSPSAAAAYSALVDVVSRASAADYAASRRDELAEAGAALDAGTLKVDQVPELAEQAMAARAELSAAEAQAAADLARDVAERDEARARRDEAQARLERAKAEQGAKAAPPLRGFDARAYFPCPRGNRLEDQAPWAPRPALGGLKSSLKKIGKQFSQAAGGATGAAAKFDRERKRLGRRLDKEMQREIATVAFYAPWIEALAPFLVFIPILGWLLYPIVIAIVASAEITYAYKQKRAVEKATADALRALRAEIEALNAEAAEFDRLAVELEARRLELVKLIEEEAARRGAVVVATSAAAKDNRRFLILGGAGIVGATMLAARRVRPKRKTLVKVAGAAAFLGLVVYAARRN